MPASTVRRLRGIDAHTISAANQPFNLQAPMGLFYDRVDYKAAGTLTITGGAAAEDGVHRWLTDFELHQSGDQILKMNGQDLYWLSSFYGGTADKNVTPSSTGLAHGSWSLPFSAILPGSGIDASTVPVFVRGKHGAFSEAHSGSSASFSGTMHAHLESTSVMPDKTFFRPAFQQLFVNIDTAQSDQTVTFDFPRNDMLLLGFLLRTEDASGGAASQPAHVDGLIHRWRLDHNGEEIKRYTTGLLKEETRRRFRLDAASQPNGIYWFPVDSNTRKSVRGATAFGRTDTLTFHLNSVAGDVEEEFSNVVNASSDRLVISAIMFERVMTAEAEAQLLAERQVKLAGRTPRGRVQAAGSIVG